MDPSGRKALRALLAGLSVVLAVAACDRGKHDQAATPAAGKAAGASGNRTATAAEQTASMVQAPTVGKANAPVDLRFDINSRPVSGQTIIVSLALIATAPAQSATLHFEDSPGLVFADRSDIAIGALQPDSVSRQEVRVTATADGVYFIGVTVILVRDSLSESRRFSIPVIVSAR